MVRTGFPALIFSFLLLLSSSLLMAESTPAQATQDCSCTALSWQEVFDQSSHVVFGEVKTVQNHGDALATADFRNLEVFKGEENYVTKIVGSAVKGGSCRAVLRSGFYLVFVKDSNSAVLNPCSQSRKLDEDLVATLTAVKAYAESKAPAGSALGEAQQVNAEMVSTAPQSAETVEEASSDWWQTLMEWKQDIIDWFEE